MDAIINHDVHVHTTLSACCHDPAATPRRILEKAAEAGLDLLGFADHLWDPAVPGASPWYAPQDVEHVLRTRACLAGYDGPVRVLVGCETEYCGNGKLGISREAARRMDFVLAPISHLHMASFVAPPDLSHRDAARLMVERFLEVVSIEWVTGIAHPFIPLGYLDHVDSIVGSIPDADLRECFGRAAEARKSIEIHLGMFQGLKSSERPGFHDATFDRVLTAAKSAGCRFHFASDAHTLEGVGSVCRLEPKLRELGIGPGDVTELFRRIRPAAVPG
jgi:histidinol phosphatase-like PHP family hydrolase